MVDYEKGSPAWDIGQILTRHEKGLYAAAGGARACSRVAELRRSATENIQGAGITAERRLELALETPCTCGIGDSSAERTSVEV